MTDLLPRAALLIAALAAAFAGWNALETRRARTAADRAAAERLVRVALMELADAVHRWRASPPILGSLAWTMEDRPVLLPATRELAAEVALPAETLAYLVWCTEAVRIVSTWYLAVLNDRVPQHADPSGWASDEGQNLWWAVLGRLLDTERTVSAAARRLGMARIVEAFGPMFEGEVERDPAPEQLFAGTWEPLPPAPSRPSG